MAVIGDNFPPRLDSFGLEEKPTAALKTTSSYRNIVLAAVDVCL
jgi:hypothetical protein